MRPAKTTDAVVKSSSSSAEPSSLVPTLLKLSIGIACLVGHVVLSGKAPMSGCYDPTFIATHDVLSRWVYLHIALTGARLKFYFVWMTAEGSSNLAGFGFQGYDKEGRVVGWDGVQNIDIIGTETASCIQHLSRAWNKRTQGWLERYTYARTGRSLFATYFVSALWHGLYPGFFVFFMSLPLLTQVERLFRAKINPLLAPGYDGFDLRTYPKTWVAQAYWYTCLLVNTVVIDYCLQVSLQLHVYAILVVAFLLLLL